MGSRICLKIGRNVLWGKTKSRFLFFSEKSVFRRFAAIFRLKMDILADFELQRRFLKNCLITFEILGPEEANYGHWCCV